jgi:maleylpyruvate isomerase
MADIEECRNAHDRLIADIVDLSDDQVAQPSRLPDWTRAHVLSHLASNADSVLRRLAAAREGRLVDQYADGAEGRRDEIERGSMRAAGELVDLVRRTAREVDELFASFPEEAWERPIRAVDGPDRPARLAVFSRWREVEAHHVDLDVGYNVEDWPRTLVDRWLPSTMEGLPGRADQNELLGWLLGRGPAPLLRPWG